MDNKGLIFDINNYIKIMKIGEGGSAEVFKIKNKNTGEILAAKIFLHEINEKEQVLSLVREVNIMSSIHHPSIIQCKGYSQVNFNNERKPVIVLEYMKNKSLYDIIELERKSLADHKWDDTQKLINIYGIASGMKYLHKNNIIHRDLKPLNILIDELLCPKISDFGLSKDLQNNLTGLAIQSMRNVKGTAAYIAPEIWGNCKYSPASDVYAFGMIVYELITLEEPFKNLNHIEIANKVMSGNRPEFPFEIPEAYKSLIKRCWMDDENERPTFDQIVDELRNNDDFILENINFDDFISYTEYIDESTKTYDSEKRIISYEDFFENRNPAFLNKANITQKRSLKNFFGLFKREYKPKNIYPKDDFKLLDKDCQNLVNEALFQPDKQFIVGKNLIQGINNFPLRIDIGIQYLEESIEFDYIESAVYYSNLLLNGDIVPQNIDMAKKILAKFLKKNNSRIHFLYAKIMKKKKYYSESLKYFGKASKEGNPDAMFEYAKMIMNEDSKNKKISEALHFLDLSKRNGCKNSQIFLDIYERMNTIHGFTNLPTYTKKFFVSQIYKYENNEAHNKKKTPKITIKPKHLQFLFSNNSLVSYEFINVLRTFRKIKIIMNFNIKNLIELYRQINNNIAPYIPSLDIHLNISGITRYKFDFGSCPFINNVTIDQSVNNISAHAFEKFLRLTEIDLPNSIKLIDDYTFAGCTSLKQIKIPPSVISINDMAFLNCSLLTNVEIPSSVKHIGNCAFSECARLAGIIIPSSMTIIKSFSFKNCSSLTQITIPSSITCIEKGAFAGCSSLTHIIFETNCCKIANDCFSKCTSLTHLTASKSILKSFNDIGNIYKIGKGVEINQTEACMYYKLAADNGFATSMFNYGTMLFNGFGVQQNKTVANHYYKKAADNGNVDGMFNYGNNLANRNGIQANMVEANHYYKLAADNGHVTSMFIYGSNLEKGKGITKNINSANHYYKLAADKGHVKSMFIYALNLEKGQGIAVNKKEASVYYKMAANKNHTEAMFKYGQILDKGDGVPVNKFEACKYYKMAMDNNHVDAEFNYAYMLEKGTGIETNKQLASVYYKDAADRGNVKAMFHYAYMNEKGNGIPINTEVAKTYYKMAADRGDDNSLRAYKNLRGSWPFYVFRKLFA